MDDEDREGESIRAQLAALRAGPKSRLRRFRALEYVCAGCGETILSVMNTTPYRVISGRGEAETEPPVSPEARAAFASTSPSAREWSEFYRSHADWTKMGRSRADREGGSFIRIRRDFEETARADTEVFFMCRCNQWQLKETVIAADLRAGVRKRSWEPARRESE